MFTFALMRPLRGRMHNAARRKTYRIMTKPIIMAALAVATLWFPAAEPAVSAAAKTSATSSGAQSVSVSDTRNGNLSELFKQGGKNTTYIISYAHDLSKTCGAITVPEGCNLVFVGNGSIRRGTVMLRGTRLSGNVDMKGCVVKGTAANSVLYANWVCYADGKTDDAPSLNSLVALGKHVVVTEGVYRMATPLYLAKSDFTLEGTGKAVLQNTTDPNTAKAILSVGPKKNSDKQISNVKIAGLMFEMPGTANFNLPAQKEKHAFEHTHAIEMFGTNNAEISNCTIGPLYGDGIYLGLFDNSTVLHNTNVTIKDNTIDGKNKDCRNGISIIDGNGVSITANNIVNTSCPTMPGAIDIEPNYTRSVINNITISDNYINRCRGGVAAISVVISEKACPASNITITRNTIEFENNAATAKMKKVRDYVGFFFRLKGTMKSSGINVSNNYVGNGIRPYRIDDTGNSPAAIKIKNNIFAN